MVLDVTRHRPLLIRILKDIYSEQSLASVLGFKGGTALYVFYGLGRFSVDLDFDLLPGAEIEVVQSALGKILATYGEIKESTLRHHTLFFLLSYGPLQQNIKVEVSLRDFGSRFELQSYLGVTMQVMVQSDMFAHKLVALLERAGRSNRDIYDVWFMLDKQWKINPEIVEKRTGKSLGAHLQDCIEAISQVDERKILAGIGELLDVEQKRWVKAKLKEEVLFLLRLRLESVGVS